ncbi:hypothetical protein NKR23_g11737 [Pleurostoma richardsiae]|uniref:Zn(2)-C6 fungal-type domain-containing protein n=1 Tax=Pleurostoma richardsiae TaxID=41990 RepID=A0AA38RIK0_9PEZI|nr:hypothetical protein NKR23_g11737 [Pleurostoma richardsiae]
MSAHQTGNRDAGEDVGSSPLACRRCKRRKVKCNRALPDCLMCIKTGASCEYPISPEKPGPKLGSSHKKRRVHSRAGTSLQATAAARSSISGVSTAPGGIIHDNSNALSPRQRVDDPGTSSLVETPSVASGAAQDDGANPPGAPTFSQIMYPSHETQTRPQSPSVYGPSPDKPKGPSKEDIKTVCEGLKISNGAYRAL